MLKKKFLIYIFSFLGGVLLHSIFLDASLNNTLLLSILFFSFLFFIFGEKYMKIIALSTVIFILGFLRFDLSLNIEEKHVLDYFANEKIEVVLEGKISEKPLDLASSKTLIVDVTSLILGNKKENLKTKISLKTYDYKEYYYGQKIRFKIVPQIPISFEVDGGRIFDYEHFLEKDSIYYTAKSYDIEILSQAERSIFSSLYFLKDSLLKQIYRYIPKPESSLLAGVLLGEKTALGEELEQDFRTTGLMHIVVLSGYNVSIIIIAVTLMLSFLPIYTRSAISVFLIVAFALLVGAGPTVIRASVMAFFVVIAKIVGRQYRIERTLLLAGVFMVIYNPWVLYFDISFQFSFLATYGLIVLMPLLEKPLSFLPNTLAMRDSAGATISAQIMVMPLILFYIGDFSIISVLVNMLVLFMVPVSMALGFITAFFGFFFSSVAEVIAIASTYSLKYILVLVEFFADVPFAKFTVSKFSFWWIIFYYCLLFFYIYKKRNQENLDDI